MDNTIVKNITSQGIDKTAIKNFAVYARNKLIKDIKNKAAMIGVTESGIQEPLSNSTGNIQLFDIGMQEPYRIEGKAIEQRNGLIRELKKRAEGSTYKTAYETLIEEVAYTWFNRIIAIRFMEVNNYMPDRMRILSSGVEGINEPEFITHVFETNFEFSEEEKERIIELKTDGSNLAMDELFQYLFIKQCNALNANLPELFEKTNDYTELLLTVSYNDVEGIIYKLIHDVPEANFDVNSENGNGQVEIIGWLYQYYNTELKTEVDKSVKSKKKVNKFQLPAKTQIFTPDWVVKYMVENSLGRLWIEILQARGDKRTDKNIASEFDWKYYLPEAEQDPGVNIVLIEMRKDRSNIGLESITFLDPAMGSFHIGVYAFEVFMQLYESEGYTKREAVRSVIENNLYGLEIDKRAAQLSYFACMMQARKHYRRILDESIHPNIYEISESNDININHLHYMGKNIEDKEIWNKQKEQIESLLHKFCDAKEYGSLIDISSKYEFKELKNFVLSSQSGSQISLFDTLGLEDTQSILINILNAAQILSQKYDVIVTNPPYLGSSAMNAKLVKFGKKYYPNSKSDLFAMFIESWNKRVKANGCNAMVTMQSWMFLSSYKNMRADILNKYTISNLMHMDNMVMGIAFGTAATLFWNRPNKGFVGTYNYVKSTHIKENKPIVFPDKNYRFAQINQEQFRKIPGNLIAYSANEEFMPILQNKDRLYKHIDITGSQHITANNDMFLRNFWEVNFNHIGKKWVTYAKGGSYRKWWGNMQLILDWSHEAQEFYKKNKTSNMLKEEYRFREGITWTATTNNKFSARVLPNTGLFDKKGPALFVDKNFNFVLGLLNSSAIYYILKLLKSGSDYQNIEIKNLPMANFSNELKDSISRLVLEAIDIAKEDWNALETSLEYDSLKFVSQTLDGKLEILFSELQKKQSKRHMRLKKIEEEINQYVIESYSLEDELSPYVEDKDVSINHLTLKEIVKSFMSYVVGCMFGRYSVKQKGIVLAGGELEEKKYGDYIPSIDNIIPIIDDIYSSNNIMKYFEKFLINCYGEKNLEENLDFIANTLNNKNLSSREKIQNYFINEFYVDHVKLYQKHPIYWLYDSGKQNGFKALVYMHRYDEDTTGKVRVDYLHQVQRAYERTIANLQEDIADSKDAKETTQLQKRLEKVTKQLKECRDYDERLGHMALERVAIDLDDGVKVNYEKVQTDSKGEFHQILAKIK